MTKAEIIEFLNGNPACRLATMDGDQPRVRGMLMYRADDTGIIFHTGITKDVFRQVSESPKVEMCFNSPDNSQQVRVAGTAEIVEDEALLDEIMEARPFLKDIAEQFGKEVIKIVRIINCVATVWTMETNMAPKEFVTL